MMRSMAITGSADTYRSRIAGRQGGRWARQTIGAAFAGQTHPQGPGPGAPPPPRQPRPDKLASLTDLHARGVITDAEFEQLRMGLRL
jgi:hypothetical protein